ncbi:MAG: Spy/CpxP family protein refolding chaperone [Pseudomonadota bacterium]
MKARNALLTIAVAGALGALATATLAHGPGWGSMGASGPTGANSMMAGVGPMMGMGGMGMRGGPSPEIAQARLDQLKAALNLQPNQLEAWNAFEAHVKAQAQEAAKMREAMRNFQGDSQALADQRVAWLKQRAQAAEELNALRKNLYATLTPEQKATFDRFSPGPGGMAGYGAGHRYGCRA